MNSSVMCMMSISAHVVTTDINSCEMYSHPNAYRLFGVVSYLAQVFTKRYYHTHTVVTLVVLVVQVVLGARGGLGVLVVLLDLLVSLVLLASTFTSVIIIESCSHIDRLNSVSALQKVLLRAPQDLKDQGP